LEHHLLAELAQRGDKEAFSRLVKDCENSMYRVSKAILKYDEDCADAIQETILKAYINLHTLKKPSFFKTWLIRILINECNRIYRSRKKVIPLVKWPEPSQVEQGGQNQRLDEAIQSLDEDFRVVVTLFYLEDFSIKEISELVHISEGTIKSRLNRARAKLAQFLKGQNERSVSDGKKSF
jgi:RNA polymerase sigma-70 factor (ECF subfamily)